MTSLCLLPRGLLVLLLALPALSNAFSSNHTEATVNTTSPLDPFRQLRLRASSKPSEPICCLVPLSTEPLPTTAEFLSFEEWKSKQREIHAQAQAANQTPSPDASALDAPSGSSAVPSSTVLGDPEPLPPPPTEPVPALSPHFRVPLTDRFNYASLDCSARVHTSHRSARSPAAILSSKKDRYMLSPCSTDPNFVVVELCDDIRIDTVQLANFEFFSGVFRDFTVSVAQTYTSDGQGWIEAGTYRAKNIRGVQSFHPLVELRPFYRYIRIDFLTHYGNEFYCPVSLLRVYGLTQMEEWKWEVWQNGADNGARALPEAESATVESIAPENHTVVTEVVTEATTMDETIASLGALVRSSLDTQVTTSALEMQNSQAATNETGPTSAPIPVEETILNPVSDSIASVSTHHIASSATTSGTAESGLSTSPLPETNASSASASTPPISSPAPLNAMSATSSNVSVSTLASSHSSSVQIIVPIPSPSPIPSGESIYRTIMNRLAMLETNTTLYQKYVEEQTLQVREALRRLEEDVGRLEGISKAQQHVFSKTMNELEMRRRQMEEERWELLTKVGHLADEVILEKRLGIAQLCLLLTVLVFMALTRGSRADATSLLDGTMHRLNSFSRRPPWSSADWRRKGWTSRSLTPTPIDFSTINTGNEEEGRSVPIASPTRKAEHLSAIPFPATPPARSQTPRSHVRQPSTPRHHDISRPASAVRPSGRLRRSNSHTTPANGVVSAKRFARTAHLHEVQPSVRGREKASEKGSGEEDESVPVPGDGSPKPRREGKELSLGIQVLPEPSASRRVVPTGRTVGGEESETGSWTDTELGSDHERDCDSAVDAGGQDVELSSEFSFEKDARSVIMSAPPYGRRRHFEGHTPPSPASVRG